MMPFTPHQWNKTEQPFVAQLQLPKSCVPDRYALSTAHTQRCTIIVYVLLYSRLMDCSCIHIMDVFIMLLCCYRSTNVLYSLQPSNTFAKLVDFICSKFNELLSRKVVLFYKIPSYNNFTLQSDVGIQNMICLAHSFHLQTLLLQSCCPHKTKVFISAPWATGFTYVGQHFEGGASEFHNFLQKDAVECRFQIKFLENDSVRANRFFYQRKWNSEHICGVIVCTSTNPLVGSGLVANIISERVRKGPQTHPTEVILNLKQDYSLDITYHVAWLGVKKARGELFGAYSVSFDQLRWYSNTAMKHNPDTHINIEYNEHTHRFTRYFLAFKACNDGFNHCRPLLFLDVTFLKGRYKRFLLAATAKNRNQGQYIQLIQ
ncbi:hypothetical protein ACSBR1_036136 [Camellia fascicularis]